MRFRIFDLNKYVIFILSIFMLLPITRTRTLAREIGYVHKRGMYNMYIFVLYHDSDSGFIRVTRGTFHHKNS